MPIQPTGAKGVAGRIEVLPEFVAGLQDLDGFSHVILLYHLHRAGAAALTVTPFLDTRERGVFATRAPTRPNPIGLSVLELDSVGGGIVHLRNVDILDGSPVLDIKPYVPAFDVWPAGRIGWLAETGGSAATERSDDRFRAAPDRKGAGED
jgi:tRNA-Thr(GGU) m(6)t(6)A37 methyltransferase TsaA